MRNKNIITWNCDGFFAHFPEYQLICKDYEPIIFNLQETKFKFKYMPQKLGKYICYIKNFKSQNNVAQGGVMTLVNENFHSTEVPLRTNLQAIAVKVAFPICFVICNLYLLGSKNIIKTDINDLITQLGPLFMIVTDANAHNILWGSNRTEVRGKLIEELILENNLNILNDGSQTHFSLAYKSFSAIDLTI